MKKLSKEFYNYLFNYNIYLKYHYIKIFILKIHYFIIISILKF